MSPHIRHPEHSYSILQVTREVRNACHSPVCLDPAPAAEVVVISQTGATLTGIPRVARYPEIGGEGDQQDLNEAGDTEGGGLSQLELKELALALTGTRLLPGSQPFASCYGGHQFGNWAGQLGDGRVATLGEIRAGGSRDSAAGVAATWEGHLVEVRGQTTRMIAVKTSERKTAQSVSRHPVCPICRMCVKYIYWWALTISHIHTRRCS